MNALREWLTAICFAAIAAGIVNMLAPSGGIQKTLKTLAGVFMLCVIAFPLLGGMKFDFDVNLSGATASEQTATLTDTVLEQMKTQATERITAEVNKIMIQCEIYDAEIEINMDIIDSCRISISQVGIRIPKKDIHMADLVKKLVQNQLGLYADVYSLEEAGE